MSRAVIRIIVVTAAMSAAMLSPSAAYAHLGHAPPSETTADDGVPAPPELPSADASFEQPGLEVKAQSAEPELSPTPQAACQPRHSHVETDMQGRVPAADHESGRVTEGYRCNADLVGSFLPSSPAQGEGGLKVERYVDGAGHECAYFDTTQLFPSNAFNEHGMGVYVLDMADPAKPVKTAALTTPAMLTPHESLMLNQKRGLLVAVAGNLATAPGIVDVYDVTKDCRQPEHLSSTPTGIAGHESGFAPDGRTFYAASFASETIVAVDLDDPRSPQVLWAGNIGSHGLSVSDDGNRIYVAALDLGDTAAFLGSPVGNLDASGLLILDTSEIQARTQNPVVKLVGTLTWSTVSTPQNAIPITIKGHPYVLEVDEFGAQRRVGAARIIDVADETKPFVVSNLRLAVHQEENFEELSGDPSGSGNARTYGYSAHYCNVPTRVDPGIAACTMIGSGLRIFDIRDPERPREVAYFNAPLNGGPQGSSWAMASPTFVPERREVWYSDVNSGFYAVQLTEAAWPGQQSHPQPETRPAAVSRGALPATGGTAPWAPVVACLGLAAVVRRMYGPRRRRSP
jgi:hypothetical protein